MNKNQKLEHRLNLFAVEMLHLSDELSKISVLRPIANQIARSGSSPALNYGEAQGAQSRADFLHKIHISLKEMRETKNSLKIVSMTKFVEKTRFEGLLKECDELAAILYTIQRKIKARSNTSN